MKTILAVVVVVCILAVTSQVLGETREGGVIVETTKKAPAKADCAFDGDTLTVHYTGRLKNAEGKIFDTSRKTGATPFSFNLGRGQVIQGWEVGMLGMCVGEIRTIVAPPAMAYGDAGFSTVIPPKATLFFEVELLGLDAGAGHPRGVSMQQVLILVPLLLVIGALCYFGYKLLNGEDKGKIKNKKK